MNNKITARTGLILVTIIWGVTFVLVKQALNDAPPFSLSTFRFGLATILTMVLINRKLFHISTRYRNYLSTGNVSYIKLVKSALTYPGKKQTAPIFITANTI